MENPFRARPARKYVLHFAALCALVATSFAAGGCSRGKQVTQTIRASELPRFEELASDVPQGFSDSRRWNRPESCPEGAVLTPFTRYEYEPGQKNHGFNHYFGRSCAIPLNEEPVDIPGRKLASSASDIAWIPHGPFVWWYETGRRMETGVFDHGTLTTDSVRFDPDGSLTAKR